MTVSLKEDDTDSEELEQIARRKRYFLRRRIYAAGNQRIRRPSDNRISGDQPRGRTRRHTAPSERNFMDIMTSPQNRTTRTFRNRSASLSRFRSSKQNFKQDGFWVIIKETVLSQLAAFILFFLVGYLISPSSTQVITGR